MLKKLSPNIFSILLILIVPVLALWQVSFCVNTMKWDMMDYYFPTRYFMSECFANNTMPWWCPYIHPGYPFYADPQSGFWYPFDFLIALTVGYNAYTLQAEFIVHLAIAALGIYKLLQTFGISKEATLAASVVYPLSGFFIGHSSHPTLVIGMAWMPFIFHYFISGLREQKLIRFIQTGLVLALCLTGGYVVFFVFACYALFFIFLFYTVKNRKQEKYIQRNVFFGVALSVTFFLLCSGYLFSLYQVFPFLKRANALSLDIVNINSLSPKSLTSFLFPFASLANTTSFDTDITMRNIYSGLLLAPLMVVGLFSDTRKRNFLLLACGLFCLAAAMGKYLPVRGWLYYTLPFMKMFRHASIFRAFAIFCFLLLAANGLNAFFTRYSNVLKKVFLFALAAEAVVLLLVFCLAMKHENLWHTFRDFIYTNRISDFIENGNIYKCLLIQGVLQLGLMTLMLPIFFFIKEKKLAVAISLFWIADIMLAAQMNVHGTVVSDNRVSDFHTAVKNLPQGFPTPDLNRAVESYGIYGSKELEPLVWNASILRKEPCNDGFNPFYLKQIAVFFDSPVSKHTLKQPEIFLSDRINLLDSIDADAKSGRLNNNSIYAEVVVANVASQNPKSELLLKEFKPGSVIATTKTEQISFLTLLQCQFEGWKVFVDEKEASIIKTNYAFMSVMLPAGEHQVSFEFKPVRVYFFFAVYVLSYLGVFGLLLYHIRKKLLPS